ncbi:MAG: protein-tyrosine-phosphatase [Bacteroidia bacterium]
MENSPANFLPKVSQFVSDLKKSDERLETDRKNRLTEISDFIRRKKAQGEQAALIFICTHNSRRSHFGQIWAQVLADYYGVSGVKTYSGGTEATAFNPNAITALRKTGFEISAISDSPNPQYEVAYGENIPPLTVWSKVYSDPANPQSRFCAIMTCSEADEACPAVFGAEIRISLPFDDPKKSDGTPAQAETYAQRSRQIAAELDFVFQQLM